MKKNQKGFGIIEMLIILLTAFLILGAAFYVLKGKTRVAINAEGQSFSFDIGQPAKVITRSSQGKTSEYFQAAPKDDSTAIVATVYKPTASVTDLKDTCKYEKFDVVILDKPHTVCNQKNVAFIANFDSNDTWYQIAVFPENMKTELQQSDVAKLMESIKDN
jgi:hypothetical protein